MNQFFRTEATEGEMLARFEYPDNYMVFDLETTGFSPHKDLVIEVGWAIVRNRKIVDCNGMLLDWTQYPGIDQGWLRSSLERLDRIYYDKGRKWHIPYERLSVEGVEPRSVLAAMAQLLHEAVDDNEWIVGHNAWNFDRRMMDGQTHRFLGGAVIPWKPGSIVDTGLIEKAIQLGRVQRPEETQDEWYGRISGNRSKVQWNLDGHCAQKYHLVERFGLDVTAAHQAGFDCILTHCLFETYRMVAEAIDGEEDD